MPLGHPAGNPHRTRAALAVVLVPVSIAAVTFAAGPAWGAAAPRAAAPSAAATTITASTTSAPAPTSTTASTAAPSTTRATTGYSYVDEVTALAINESFDDGDITGWSPVGGTSLAAGPEQSADGTTSLRVSNIVGGQGTVITAPEGSLPIGINAQLYAHLLVAPGQPDADVTIRLGNAYSVTVRVGSAGWTRVDRWFVGYAGPQNGAPTGNPAAPAVDLSFTVSAPCGSPGTPSTVYIDHVRLGRNILNGGGTMTTGTGTVRPTTAPVTTAPTTTGCTTTSPVGTTPNTTTTTPRPSTGCTADYRIVSSWPGGFLANVAVRAGSAPVAGWKVTWTYDGGQRVTSYFSARVTQSGPKVTAINQSWNGRLAAGGSASFGVIGASPTPGGLLAPPVCTAA